MTRQFLMPDLATLFRDGGTSKVVASHPGGSRNTITLTYYRNREKHLPDGLLGLYADLLVTFTYDL